MWKYEKLKKKSSCNFEEYAAPVAAVLRGLAKTIYWIQGTSNY